MCNSYTPWIIIIIMSKVYLINVIYLIVIVMVIEL